MELSRFHAAVDQISKDYLQLPAAATVKNNPLSERQIRTESSESDTFLSDLVRFGPIATPR